MAAKSIVEVEIKDGQFRDFYEMFQKYQKQLSDMPEDWKKVVDVIGEGGDEMGGFAKSSKSSKEFLMIAAIQADAISKAMARATGVQDKFNTKAKDGAIQMSRMSKFSKEMHKSIAGMSTILLKLGTAGVGGIGSAIGAVYGATNQLAGQNLQARGLGLKIGQAQAFEANFEKFGLGTSDLGNVANAQSDVSKWRAFTAAGLTPDQIQNEDAEQLTFDFARKASGKYKEWQKAGMPAASMAQAYGFTDILSQQQLRTGASYSDADWQKAQEKEISDAKKNAIDQGTADQASDVKAALKSDWAQVMNEFNGQLAQLSPELKTMGDAASAAAVNLLKVAGPEAKKVLDALEGGPVSRDAAKQGGVVGGLAKVGYGIRDAFPGLFGQISTGPDGMDLMSGASQRYLAKMGMSSTFFSAFENKNKLPPGLLYAQEMTESGGNVGALSPRGAMGPFQFMPDTAKQYGLQDPFNLHDSGQAAGRMMGNLMKRYRGDVRKSLAAYNWGMGNLDKDIAANGDKWEQHAPKETQQYIGKIMALMAKQGQSVNINITNSTTANVATSMNAAPH